MLGRKNVNIGDFFVLQGDFGTENLSLQSFYFELFFICFVMIKSVKTLLFVVMLCLSVTVMAKSAGRDYWIDRYLSVSYPLRSIKVNSSFGARKDPFTGEQSTHSGLDLQAHYEEVYSMFDGSIEQIGSDPRSGNYVILRHGSYTVSYCHMSRITVRKGEEVIAGAPVGISGNSGRSTGPHLHITCKYKGEFRDPYTLLVYIKEVRAEAVTALGGRNRDNKFQVRNVGKINQNAFFNKYANAAMDQQQRYGIPASVILAQMAYESYYGQSTLAVTGNNFFGIKCTRDWIKSGKPYSVHDDDRKDEKFCNYASAKESIEHHSRLLMSNRYKRCRRFSATDYHNWLVGIKAAGYATYPGYVRTLENMIKRYKLYLYDRLAQKAFL